MSDCCSTPRIADEYPKKHKCPVNQREYGRVSANTIKLHIKAPWTWTEKKQGYYFCSDPDCNVVYFGEDGSVIDKQAMRTEVGVKEDSDSGLICYCYGVSRLQARTNPHIREFIIEETRNKGCACESRNPSGQCCLADFPER